MQMTQTRGYFYGPPAQYLELSPCLVRIKFDDVRIYRTGEGRKKNAIQTHCPPVSLAPSSALPIGADRQITETSLILLEASDKLLHAVLAILDAPADLDPTQPAAYFARGFVYVSEVDEKNRHMTVLSPAAEQLPSSVLLQGSFRYVEI